MRLRLGIRVKAVKAWGAITRWNRQRARTELVRKSVERLHIGCGQHAIPDWYNVDLEELPGVDLVHDVRSGLPFHEVSFAYAEHFIEHLTFDEGIRFMKECREALRPDGVLRLSTPNLDWVVAKFYQPETWSTSDEALRGCFELNKAFRGWGHQFLYNRTTLAAALHASGFEKVEFRAYGQSPHAELSHLERHETYADTEDLPHVVIAEASGVTNARLDEVLAVLDEYDEAVRTT